ncbi:CDC73-domain-containing protein [Ramicandelaber brevisporus]|nr:CDC73-domain-containing protein [Ramicandelaber brevisporus]
MPADLLNVMRQAVRDRQKCVFSSSSGTPEADIKKATHVFIPPSHIYPRNERVVFKPKVGADIVYPLESVLFMFQHKDLELGGYIKLALEAQIKAVSYFDRGTLIEYLTSKGESGSQAAVSSSAKAASGSSGASSSTSKAGAVGSGDVDSRRADHPKSSSLAASTASTHSSALKRHADGSRDAAKAAGSAKHGSDRHPAKVARVEPPKPKYQLTPAEEADARAVLQITNLEYTYVTRQAVLQGPTQFSGLQQICSEITSSKATTAVAAAAASSATGRGGSGAATGSSSRPGASASANPAGAVAGKQRKVKDTRPIIIIPSARTSLINMYNIKDFLEGEKFVDPTAAREKMEDSHPDIVTIRRQRQSAGPASSATTHQKATALYVVYDSVHNFKPEDWDRVVCVFTTGADWQFKGWKWSLPEELFKNVQGFYAKYSDDAIKEPASRWPNVKAVDINRQRRHMDSATVMTFWRELEAYITANKPYLTF